MPLLKQVEIVCIITEPVDGIVFVIDDFLRLLDEGPNKLILFTFTQHLDRVYDRSMLIIKDFFLQGDRQVV